MWSSGRLAPVAAFLGLCLSPFAAAEESLALKVWIAAPDAAGAVQRAAEGARRRLKQDTCRAVLSDFADAFGRSLQRNLDQLGLTAADYLTFIILVDAEDRKTTKPSPCRNPGTLAFTTPGSRVVRVCTPQFVASKRAHAENAVIHEMLHTLGLGENPPSSSEITHRVRARCGP